MIEGSLLIPADFDCPSSHGFKVRGLFIDLLFEPRGMKLKVSCDVFAEGCEIPEPKFWALPCAATDHRSAIITDLDRHDHLFVLGELGESLGALCIPQIDIS